MAMVMLSGDILPVRRSLSICDNMASPTHRDTSPSSILERMSLYHSFVGMRRADLAGPQSDVASSRMADTDPDMQELVTAALIAMS